MNKNPQQSIFHVIEDTDLMMKKWNLNQKRKSNQCQ